MRARRTERKDIPRPEQAPFTQPSDLRLACACKVTHVVSLKQGLIPPSVGWFYLGASRQFSMDKHCVRNDQFAFFVEESGYVTEAEKFEWSFALE